MGPGYGAVPTVPMVMGTKNHQAKTSGLCPEGDGASLRGVPEKSPDGSVAGTREKTLSSFSCRL